MRRSCKPRHSIPLSSPKPKSNRGFILIATLALLALAVTAVVVVTTFTRLQTGMIEARSGQSAARQNALAALDIALGQLQFTSGNDRVITAPALTLLDTNPLTPEPDGIENPYWTEVIDSTNGKSYWLVSSTGIPDPLQGVPRNAVTLVGPATADPNDDTQRVTVEKVAIQTQPNATSAVATTGYYAYWTGELNTRANVTVTDTISEVLPNDWDRSANQLQLPRRSSTESLFPSIGDPDDSETREKLYKVETPQQLYFLQKNREELRRKYFSFTTQSKSVITNPITGGLKVNLTDSSFTDNLVTSTVRQQITPNYYTRALPDNYQVRGDDPMHALAINETPAFDQLLALHQPIITEFSLSMGLFHTQSDKRHRLRFHMHVEWLNPYPYDMGFNNAKAYVIIADNLPTVEITNVTSGQNIIVDLNDFDESLYDNDLNESKINSWMEFDELSDRSGGSLQYGIDAGRVYRMSEPDKTTQPRGLSRTIGDGANKWSWGGAAPPANLPRAQNTIYGSDTIRIRSTTPVQMNLLAVPMYDGTAIPSDTDPDVYATQKGYVLKMTNIPFEDFDIYMNGSTYSRSNSGSFSPNDYRIAFHFKLQEDEATFASLATLISTRDPVLDFSKSAIRNLYEMHDVVEAARQSDPLTDEEKFWDDSERDNTSSPNPEEYQFCFFDIPIQEPLTPGVFSLLHFNERPEPWVGSTTAKNTDWNSVYDRYFFSGTLASSQWNSVLQPWSPTQTPAGILKNHRIRPIFQANGKFPEIAEMTKLNSAAYSLLDGGFNIFSSSADAWTAFLDNKFRNNSTLAITNGNGNSNVTGEVFSRLPYGSPKIQNQLADSGMDSNDDRNKVLYRQGVRAIDNGGTDADSEIHTLAQSIVSGIRTTVSGSAPDHFPIRSIRDLINLGVIDTAIQDPSVGSGGLGINSQLDPINPGYLRQSDVFALLGPQMTVRSDTFVIRCYGEATHPRSQKTLARAYGEAVVQRYPDYMVDSDRPELDPTEMINITLGRRYRIVSFRWLQPFEI